MGNIEEATFSEAVRIAETEGRVTAEAAQLALRAAIHWQSEVSDVPGANLLVYLGYSYTNQYYKDLKNPNHRQVTPEAV